MELTNVNSLPFIYPVSATLAANSSGSQTLIFQADSRFEMMAIFASTRRPVET